MENECTPTQLHFGESKWRLEFECPNLETHGTFRDSIIRNGDVRIPTLPLVPYEFKFQYWQYLLHFLVYVHVCVYVHTHTYV